MVMVNVLKWQNPDQRPENIVSKDYASCIKFDWISWWNQQMVNEEENFSYKMNQVNKYVSRISHLVEQFLCYTDHICYIDLAVMLVMNTLW